MMFVEVREGTRQAFRVALGDAIEEDISVAGLLAGRRDEIANSEAE